MTKRHPENERLKRAYLVWLKEARGRSEETLDIAAAAIDRFQTHTRYRDFKTFRSEQAVSFKVHLAAGMNPATGKPLSKATLYSRLRAVQAFFEWLSTQRGYLRAVHISDIEYFTLNSNDVRVATATRERAFPSVNQVLHVLGVHPHGSALERRDRALIAFILLTGVRDTAAISLKLKHVDFARRTVNQDARDVKTKAAKTFVSGFFPVGDLAEGIVRDWLTELERDHLFGPDDPVFPATENGLDDAGQFSPKGVMRRHWATAAPVRAVFRKAFDAAVFGGLDNIVCDETTGAVTLDVTLNNVGRTPARVRKLTMGKLGFDPRDGSIRLPSKEADYSKADVYPTDTIFGGPEKGPVTTLEKLPTFGAIYGLIEYDDIFKDPHKSRFCLSYDGLKGICSTFGNESWNEYD